MQVNDQTMKPETAAKKLGIYLPATPESFREGSVSRADLTSLQQSPPEWLVDLRKNGPHPRAVVAEKLGISTSGLVRGGLVDALTTEEIGALLDNPPYWLHKERDVFAAVRAEKKRLKQRDAERRAAAPPPVE